MKTNYLVCQVSKKSNLSERMVTWAMKLSKYDILYILRGSIKSQVLADFVAKFSSRANEGMPPYWVLYVFGTSDMKGNGVRIVLEGPGNILIEQALNNNSAE